MIRLKINNIEFFVNSNLSVLEACHYVGIHIPRFCYHESLSIAGNCRMCLVEIEKAPKPVASCALPVSNNLSIFTDSPSVKKARENVLETILLNHPLDCPICDQGGECDLQDQTKIFGGDYSRFYENKRVVEDKPYGSFIKTIMTRCIHCTRCVRFSDEIAGTPSFGTLNRGSNTEVGSYVQNIFDIEISGTVIDLCPVGALTFKTYAFKARPWELRCQETIDFTSGVGSPLLINFKESEIVRIQPKIDFSIQNSIISDKIRFSFDSLKKNRIQNIYENEDSQFKYRNWEDFIFYLNYNFKDKKVSFLVNDSLDLETLMLVKRLTRDNIKIYNTQNLNSKHNFITSSLYSRIEEIEKHEISFCFVISVNLKIESMLLNTKLRIKYNKQIMNAVNLGCINKTNFPQLFIGLSLNNMFEILEGKYYFSNKIAKSSNILFIFGNSLDNRVAKLIEITVYLKKMFPNILIFKNEVKINSNGLKYLSIPKLDSNTIQMTDLFLCLNLDDNIFMRKILKNKKFCWFNTHGSSIALRSSYIAPTTTFFESESSFLNSDFKIQKTRKIFDGVKETKELFNIFKLFLSEYTQNFLYIQFLIESVNKKEKKTSGFIGKNILKTQCNNSNQIFNTPIKSFQEDFFLDSTFTKNSILLIKRSKEQKRLNFLIG